MQSFKDTISVIRDGQILGQTKARISPRVIAARATGAIQIEKGDTIVWESKAGLVRFRVMSASYFGKHPAHYQLQIERLMPQ